MQFRKDYLEPLERLAEGIMGYFERGNQECRNDFYHERIDLSKIAESMQESADSLKRTAELMESAAERSKQAAWIARKALENNIANTRTMENLGRELTEKRAELLRVLRRGYTPENERLSGMAHDSLENTLGFQSRVTQELSEKTTRGDYFVPIERNPPE